MSDSETAVHSLLPRTRASPGARSAGPARTDRAGCTGGVACLELTGGRETHLLRGAIDHETVEEGPMPVEDWARRSNAPPPGLQAHRGGLNHGQIDLLAVMV